jgi:hypothetical protein
MSSLIRLTCRQAARLLLQREHRMLTRVERVRLRLHLGFCGMCTRFSGQLAFMNRALDDWRAYRDGSGD